MPEKSKHSVRRGLLQRDIEAQLKVETSFGPSAVQLRFRTDFLGVWSRMRDGERGKGTRESSSRSFGTWGTRSSAATVIPGIEKRLTTAAQIATQLLDFGKERRFSFPSFFPASLISPLLFVLALPDSDGREQRRRKFNDDREEWR